MTHAPGAGSIARQVEQQSSALPLKYGRPMSVYLILFTIGKKLIQHYTVLSYSNTIKIKANNTKIKANNTKIKAKDTKIKGISEKAIVNKLILS